MSTPPQKPQYSSPEEAARIYLLPNLFTAGNMLCGFLAIKNCIEARFTTLSGTERAEHYNMAVWFILFACICDLFDGRVARATKRESLFGAEFDSIADTVSFGVAPALMACFLVIKPEATDNVQLVTWLLAFIYLLCAGVRLAFLMISNVRFPSFKKLDWTAKARTRGFILIIISGFILFRYPQFTFPAVFLGYISYSIFRHVFLLKKSEMDPAPEDDDEPVSKV